MAGQAPQTWHCLLLRTGMQPLLETLGLLALAAVLLSSGLLSSCGGVGVGGTGTYGSGPISGFGSIWVAGVRFIDTTAEVIDEDGQQLMVSDLKLGATVTVVGDTLVTDGVYGWSRNPQYVAYTLFPVGYALTGVAVMAWVGVALYLVLVHLTVLVEEEHLERQFGDVYRVYKRETPRYFRWRRKPPPD